MKDYKYFYGIILGGTTRERLDSCPIKKENLSFKNKLSGLIV